MKYKKKKKGGKTKKAEFKVHLGHDAGHGLASGLSIVALDKLAPIWMWYIYGQNIGAGCLLYKV